MILEMFISELLFTINFGSNVQVSHNDHFLCLPTQSVATNIQLNHGLCIYMHLHLNQTRIDANNCDNDSMWHDYKFTPSGKHHRNIAGNSYIAHFQLTNIRKYTCKYKLDTTLSPYSWANLTLTT